MHPTQTLSQLLHNVFPVIPSQLDGIHNSFVTIKSRVGRCDMLDRQVIKICNSHLFHWFLRFDLLQLKADKIWLSVQSQLRLVYIAHTVLHFPVS